MDIDPKCREVIDDILTRALSATYDQATDPQVSLGWELALMFMAREAGLPATRFPHEHGQVGPAIDRRLAGEALHLWVFREDAWREYTRLMKELGPDNSATRKAKREHDKLDRDCMKFAHRHQAEWLTMLAVMKLEP